MAENMYCEGNKVLSDQGKENWDKIFSNNGGNKKKDRHKCCGKHGDKCKNK